MKRVRNGLYREVAKLLSLHKVSIPIHVKIVERITYMDIYGFVIFALF